MLNYLAIVVESQNLMKTLGNLKPSVGDHLMLPDWGPKQL